jgi:hypothetical protein
MNWSVIIPGAIISAVITAFAGVIGKLISRSTTIGTANIEDRGKFTRDLLRRVETMEAEISALRKRENRVVQIVSVIGGELRVLSSLVGQLVDDLGHDKLDQKEVLSQTRQIKANVDGLAQRLDSELRTFINDEAILKLKEQQDEPSFKVPSGSD